MNSVIHFLANAGSRTVLLLLFLVINIAAYSQCNCPPVASCGACQGGMTRLTFKFNDSRLVQLFPASVTVTDGGGQIFTGSLSDGETFEVTADIEGNLFIGNQITISILLGASENIATSCATPIFVGDEFGDFEVMAGKSQGNVSICCAPADMETTPPIITGCPTNTSVSLSAGQCSKAVTWPSEPTASDNCGTPTLTSTHASGSTFPLGATVVTYTATDRYGNTSTCSFTVTVVDSSNPVITGCPSTITVNADATVGTCGTNVTWTPPTATDNCLASFTSNKSPGQFFSVGTTPVTYTATDASGRTSTCTFDVIVNDVTNPVITNCPSTITLNADATIGTCGTNVSWTPPTVTDNCVVNMTSDKAPGAFFSVGTTAVTYTATDASGRQSTCTFNVVVTDVTDPVIVGCPSNITVNADETIGTCGTNVTWTPPTVTDNCVVNMTSTKAPGSFFSVGTTPVTYTATDASGRQSTCTFNVVVNDVTNPIISGCPSTITVSANAATGTCGTNVTWTPPTVTDNCVVSMTSDKAPGAFFSVGTTAVTYTATDASGRQSTCTFNVVVNDVTNPAITGCPSTITVNADAATGTCGTNVTWTPPTVTDNCVVNMTSNKTPGQFFSVGTTPVTYTATDASGRQSTCTFNVVVNDVTNPIIAGCPSTITVNADAAAGTCGTNVTWTPPTVTDNCVVNMTSNKTPGQFFAVGTTAVTYTATDASGRTATCTFNVVVNDVNNPIITGCPSTITVNAVATAGTCGTNVTWTPPTATDNCVVNMTSNKAPGAFFAVGTTAVTYTATDASGRTATCTFNVVVNDVTNPVITGCPSTITVNANVATGTCGTNVSWTPPTATDNCVVNMTSNKSPGQFFAVGTTVVTYTATDASGRQSTCSFNVVVNDITKPVIAACPSNISVNTSTCNAVVSWTVPTASDNCSASLTSNFSPGATFPVGVTAVTYTATDPTGNVETCTFNVTVVDNVSPVYTNCLHGAIIEVTADNSCMAVATWTPPTATDNCSVVVTSNHNSGDTFPLGRTDVIYTATDPSGNSTTCSFKVFVKDRSNPVISGCVSNITTTAVSGCSAVVTWTPPTATDNCNVQLTSNHVPGETFPVGTTIVTYTATDDAGNTAQCSFNVTINDTSLPTVSGCPATISAQVTGSTCSTTVTWTPPTFNDNCSVTVTSNKSPGDSFSLGTTVVTYTGTDPTGNIRTCSFNVVVTDASSPVISNCPTDITVTAGASCNATATWIEPTFADNCSATMVGSHTPGQTFPLGQTIVTYIVTDGAGNQSTCSFKVTINDTSLPVILNCPTDISVSMENGSCTKSVTWIAPTATDNCTVTLTSNFPSGHLFPEGTTQVTYTATDGSGNIATCSFNVKVSDATAPVVASCPNDIEVNASSSCNTAVTWTPPNFTDNCGTVQVTSSHSPNDNFPVGSTTVTYTGTDASGNTSKCEFKVVVVDRTNPVIANCPSTITATTTANCSAIVSWAPPLVTDNCQATLTSTHQPGANFAIGTTLVTYTATDAAGNQSSCSFDVTVNDGSKPVFTSCPADVRVVAGTTSCSASAVWNTPQVTDCSTFELTSTHQSGATFAVGSTEITYTATDLNGNTATCSFNVIVEDKTAPVFTGCPSVISVDAGTTCDAVASWSAPVANDVCGIASVISSHRPGDVFPIGITTVTYTATDVNGNSSKCEFNVIVRNKNAPVISDCPSDQVVKVIDTDFASATWMEPTATVVCGQVSISSTHKPGDEFPVGETLVEYTAVDNAGNSSACTFKIRVEYENLDFTISKLVTPDGDGINDGWMLSDIEKFKENQVTVFDRWGGVIYAASGYDNENIVWKGVTNSGANVPTGTYFYTITVRYRGDYVERKGFIELVR